MPIPTDAQPWDEIFRREGRVFDSPAPVVHHVADVLQEHGCRRVVDLGCGSGRHTVLLAQRGFDVIGIDNSPTALSLSREWLTREELSARLALADMRRPLPFRSGVCDGVISTQVIHHALLDTVRGTASEIRRILRPGGVVFVSVHHVRTLMRRFWRSSLGPSSRPVAPNRRFPITSSRLKSSAHSSPTSPCWSWTSSAIASCRCWQSDARALRAWEVPSPALDGRPLSTAGERGINCCIPAVLVMLHNVLSQHLLNGS